MNSSDFIGNESSSLSSDNWFRQCDVFVGRTCFSEDFGGVRVSNIYIFSSLAAHFVACLHIVSCALLC